MSKRWELSEAAEKRILSRLQETATDARLATPASVLLLEAMQPENFAKPRRALRGLMARWSQAEDQQKRAWVAPYLAELEHELEELRAAGADLLAAIGTFERRKVYR